MAGEWIKMRVGLRRHPKVVQIVSALNADRLRVVGALHAVWSVFDEHSIDGHLPGYSFEQMDQEIGWPGFCAAMHGINWLDRDGDCGLVMREFSTHNGASAKRRAQESQRKRETRETDRKVSASNADEKRTREEKRRTPSLRSGEAARGTRLPKDWGLPEDLKAWALKEQPTWDEAYVNRVAENFRDYWISVAGNRGVKLDWTATWRTWVRKEGARKGPAGLVQGPSWRPGSEPDTVLREAARKLQIDPWQEGETHGQFRQRIVNAGGEDLLKPPRRAA